MKIRDIVGLLLALVLAIGVAFLTRYFLTKESETKVTDAGKRGIIKILVAGESLPEGRAIKAGDLQWQTWPENALNPAYVKEGTASINSFNGFIVRELLHKGEPIHFADLVNPGDKGVLAAILASGKRAFSIKLTPEGVSSGLIVPGDYVDVIVSKAATRGGGAGIEGEAVVKNVKVLAMGVEMASTLQAPKVPPTVATLEVTPEQADIIAAAAKEGTVSLSLHSLERTEGPLEEKKTSWEEGKEGSRRVTIIRGKEKTEIQVPE